MSDCPDPSDDWWTTTDVAAYTGVHIATISSYRRRNQMPAAERMFGRTPVWRPATIVEWHRNRPRVGRPL